MTISTFKKAVTLLAFLLTQTFLLAQIPKLISYQGILTDNQGQVLADGNYTVTVKIFDAATGGSELWSENHSVDLVSGLFNIALGSNTDLDLAFNQPYFISTTINGTELLPRSAMTASPYALNANGSGNNNQGGSSSSLDASDGDPTNVVSVDDDGNVHIGLSARELIDFDVYQSIYVPIEKRVGLKVFKENGNQSSVYGLSAHAVRESVFDFARTTISRGIFSQNIDSDANFMTGLDALADGGINNKGIIAEAKGGELNTGIRARSSGGDEDIGVEAFVDGGSFDRAFYASLGTDEGWAAYLQGKTYVGIGAAPAGNDNSLLYVNDPFQKTYYGLNSNHSSGVAGNFVGADAGIIAKATRSDGSAGIFSGLVQIYDDTENDIPAKLFFQTDNNGGVGVDVFNRATPEAGENSFAIRGVATDANSYGGFFQGGTGGFFVGNNGIEVVTTDAEEPSGKFYGPIEVYSNDILEVTPGLRLEKERVFALSTTTNSYAEMRPANLSLSGRSSILPTVNFLQGLESKAVISYNDIEGFNFKSGKMIFESDGKMTLDPQAGVLIKNNLSGSAESLGSYGLIINGGTQGLAIKLDGLTNSNNHFISFMDDSELFNFKFQGSIIGNSDVSDIAEVLESFIKSILKPDPSVSSTQAIKIPDPFDQEQKSPNSDSNNGFAKASGANSATFSTVLQTLENAAGDKVYNVEFLINQLMMFIDVLDASFTFASSFLSIADPEDIWATGVSLATTVVNLGIYSGYELLLIGVSYETASGDYAEYLIRQDSNELITYGDIVGVRAGEVSKDFIEADHFMAISKAPAMSGAAPQPQVRHLYEKVAFMGQIPVKVMGQVNKGDYILPSGNGDGLGIAVNPKKMLPKDYHRIVGIAWDESDGKAPFKMINTAVGINQNDLADIVDQMQTVMNEMQLAIKEVNPNYEVKLFQTNGSQPQNIQTELDYSVAPTHPSKVNGLFNGATFETQEEALVAISQAWKEVAQIDVNDPQFEIMKYIIDHPEQASQIAANYAQKAQSLQGIVKQLQQYMSDNK